MRSAPQHFAFGALLQHLDIGQHALLDRLLIVLVEFDMVCVVVHCVAREHQQSENPNCTHHRHICGNPWNDCGLVDSQV
jgi:hypothetical protein